MQTITSSPLVQHSLISLDCSLISLLLPDHRSQPLPKQRSERREILKMMTFKKKRKEKKTNRGSQRSELQSETRAELSDRDSVTSPLTQIRTELQGWNSPFTSKQAGPSLPHLPLQEGMKRLPVKGSRSSFCCPHYGDLCLAYCPEHTPPLFLISAVWVRGLA